jgi:hypothetical protein
MWGIASSIRKRKITASGSPRNDNLQQPDPPRKDGPWPNRRKKSD